MVFPIQENHIDEFTKKKLTRKQKPILFRFLIGTKETAKITGGERGRTKIDRSKTMLAYD